ncbi:MAG: Ty1/Copia family ribonuclease HI [Candidatus Saccharimonadales bacterium]
MTYGPDPSATKLFTTYSDADHGGNRDNRKSTGGYLVKLGLGAVSWSSKLQPVVALSTTEAEYMAAVEAGKEIIWMRSLLKEVGVEVDGPSELMMDNQSAMYVAKNPEHHGRMKHIDLRYCWLREVVEGGEISPTYVPTSQMPADLLTKPLSKALVEGFRDQMGLKF